MSQEPLEVSLNYLSASSPKPVVYVSKPPSGAPRDTTEVTPQRVAMYDARAIRDTLSLDREGFSLVTHQTRATDLWEPHQVKDIYFPEIERLVERATGASRVLAFDYNVRNFTKAKRRQDGAQMPVKFAHNDYTVKSGPQRVRDLLEPAEAEQRLRGRFAVINVWKPITGPVLEAPLAVCDARSMRPEDFVETDLKYADRTGEVYSVAYAPRQRWYYVPAMQSDEALLLKCYDSEDDGRACFTAHTAFNDPTTPPGAPARESIEVRTLVFF